MDFKIESKTAFTLIQKQSLFMNYLTSKEKTLQGSRPPGQFLTISTSLCGVMLKDIHIYKKNNMQVWGSLAENHSMLYLLQEYERTAECFYLLIPLTLSAKVYVLSYKGVLNYNLDNTQENFYFTLLIYVYIELSKWQSFNLKLKDFLIFSL